MKSFCIKCLIIWATFQLTLSVYIPNEIETTSKPYTTGLKIKTSYYKTFNLPLYHANYSKVYNNHIKNYTSSLLYGSTNSKSPNSQATNIHPVYLSQEQKDKIKSDLIEHNTNIVEKDTLNNKVVYKRRIEKLKKIEVFNKCPRGVTGQFVYDLACNQYLDCWNGRGGPRNCAPGTLFNPKTLECDFPEKVECLTGPSGSSFTLQKSAKLQSVHEQAKCPDDFSGLIPNYTDCSKFIQCNNGIQTPRDCPPGTLFDTNLNICNHESETTCFSGQQPSNFAIKEEYGGSTDIFQGQSSQQKVNWYQQSNDNGCDPTDSYCQSGGYIISGQNIYPQGSRRYNSESQQHGTSQQGSVYIQYVMCNPSSEDCSEFQQGTYMLGPSGALCNPINQQCGQGTAYVPGNKISNSGSKELPPSGTYFVKYVMCNTVQQDCSQYQKGIIQAGYGVPGSLIGAYPVEEPIGCNPQTQNCPPAQTQYSSTTYIQPGQPCNPQYQNCGQDSVNVTNQACNPQFQNCGNQGQFYSTSTQNQYPPTTYHQVSGGQGNSGQPCNPQYQNCGPGSINITYQGQYNPFLSSAGQGKTGQPCNPQYQNCGQDSVNVTDHACNPQLQNCGNQGQFYSTSTQNQYPTMIYHQPPDRQGKSSQPCNPQYQNCGPGSINITYQGQYNPFFSSGSQVSAGQGKTGQPCNPQYQNCGQDSVNLTYQGQFKPLSGKQPCNPQYQNCGPGSINTPYQGQYNPFLSSGNHVSAGRGKTGQLCNPQHQNCSQSTFNSTYRYPYTSGDDQVSYLSGRQPCNSQYQNCGQDSSHLIYQGQYNPNIFSSHVSGGQGKTGQPCNPQYQNCGPGFANVTYQGQYNPYLGSSSQNPQPSTTVTYVSGGPRTTNYQHPSGGQYIPQLTSGNQISGPNQPCSSQPCQSLGATYQHSGHTKSGTTASNSHKGSASYGQSDPINYKKVCNAGDPNCYRKQNSPSTEAKCPNDFQGITKHPTDCKKFLNCANGITYIQNCSPGTLFNPLISTCDFPYNVDCKDEEIETTTLGDDELEYYGPYEKIQSNSDCEGQACQSLTPGNQQQPQGHKPVDQGYYSQTPNSQWPQYGQSQVFYNSQTGPQYNQNKGTNGHQSGCQGTQCGQSKGANYGHHQGSYDQIGCPGAQCSQGTHIQSQDINQNFYGQTGCQGSQCQNQMNQGSQGQDQSDGCQGNECYHGQGQVQETEDGITQEPPSDGQPCQGFQCLGYTTPTSSSQGIGGWSYRPSSTTQRIFEHIMKIPTKPSRIKTVKPNSYRTVKPINKSDRVTYGGFNNEKSVDYVDVFVPDESSNIAYARTQKPQKQVWPPPFTDFSTTDLNADYIFEYEDGEPVTLVPENVHVEKKKKSKCDKSDFMCDNKSCVAKNFVCDGVRDCSDGKDEKYCQKYLDEFKPYKNSRLDVLEKQRWDNVTYSTCALLCMDNTKFECRSLNYRKIDKTCFLTNENIGSSGALKEYYPCDYYERKGTSMDCTDMHECPNKKCLTSEQICDGYDDCGDRADEKGCRAEDFGYSVKLAAGKEPHEGRIEVTVFGKTGYICDDQFTTTDANVLCKELGFEFGALEVKGNSYFAKDLRENHTLYMMDDIECLGNETSLMHCDFAGWGIHNCADREIAGVVCKTPQESCSEGYWKCDTGNECVRLPFVCDGLDDCTDNSDEASHHCDAPIELRLVNGSRENEGRLEIRHNGIWGSICDDDFNDDAAKIACNTLGFSGSARVKKDSFFGQSTGPIWLDQVVCQGNETSLEKCTHWEWGENNCDHTEDVGVICSNSVNVEAKRNPKHFGGEASEDIKDSQSSSSSPEPVSCGYRKDNIFLQNDDVHFRVVQGSIATPGDYPWQAALRIKGQDKTAHWCGAVVVSSKWVLTAAHCLEGYPKGSFIIVAGEYNIDENEGTEQQAFIEEYYLHEKFRVGHKMGNDIAMILLKGKGFKLNQDIQPICLPDETSNYERDLNCTISGFGTIQTGKSVYSHKLRAAWIPVQKLDVCKMAHIYGENIGPGMICAGDITGGIDACDGDSGGPLACLEDGVFTLYGLTSWGQRCGYANKPGVYVKVSYYKKWIEEIMKLHS